MSRGKQLSDSERAEIVKMLAAGKTTLEISKALKRDHRTVKEYVENPTKRPLGHPGPTKKSVTSREKTRLKREMARSPLATSKEIFEGAGVTMKPKTSRNRVLNQLGGVKKAIAKPALTARHKKTRYEWAENNIKREFSSVLFTDECRATLDGPDGWASGWILRGSEVPARKKRQQGGGGVMFWAGIIGDTVVGPCRVEKGVKMDSKASFLPWYRSRPVAFKRKLIFMHDNAPAHSSKFTTSFLEKNGFKGKKVLEWPSLSPDLNPIENYWSLLKREVYRQGTQYDSVHSLWSAIEDAAKKITPEEVKKLTCSMDKRLTKLLQLHGGHVGA
ncbi:hypothetical protein FOL47_010622 [Perkinsus chesapeaki]|uniref:Tc1-like transposase DDE domain-containing protein n=1 Tax=Perkinsus chesapeaki TaxID=330153 RepID=A0A7J6MPQ2_PERCH|nr:hypothetical protein FOL47_010622 [Perkinsus chesapeaki]